MSVFLAVVLKPLVGLFFFTLVLMLSRWLYRRMPDSRLKRVLFAPLPGHKPRRW